MSGSRKQRVLHLLSQRPAFTGSGITLEAIVRYAVRAGWHQNVIVATPATDRAPAVGGLPADSIHRVKFDEKELNFQVPGMSDVMPYPSTRFAEMTSDQLSAYRRAWRLQLKERIASFEPDIIHSHHVWILSSLVKDIAPTIPVVTQCHATGLRQMDLCPHLAPEVKRGCSRNDRFIVLHRQDAMLLADALAIDGQRITIVGAGYRQDIFHNRDGAADRRGKLLYVGKYSSAKGLPWLLDAVQRLAPRLPGLRLHVAGSGSGPEATALRRRMLEMEQIVVLHGQLDQPHLARLMRQCAVCVLPSLYEGVPLVLIEALACGCRLVSTDLPGVRTELAPRLGDMLTTIRLPNLVDVDKPAAPDLPSFVENIAGALDQALRQPPLETSSRRLSDLLAPFTWAAVFRRIEAVWLAAMADCASDG